MTIHKWIFKGDFCKEGEFTCYAPTEKDADKLFYGCDFGRGYGCPKDGAAIGENLGTAYEFDGDIPAWWDAVKMGEVSFQA